MIYDIEQRSSMLPNSPFAAEGKNPRCGSRSYARAFRPDSPASTACRLDGPQECSAFNASDGNTNAHANRTC